MVSPRRRRAGTILFALTVSLVIVSANGCGGGSDSDVLALYLVNVDGSNLTKFWSQESIGSFAWSPDGHSIAVGSWPKGPFVLNVDNGERTALAGSGWIPLGWAEDGSFVATLAPQTETVTLVPPDGSQPAFEARGSRVSWRESGDVAFFRFPPSQSTPGLVVAARTPDGWMEIGNHRAAVKPVIDEHTGRYAFTEGTTVYGGEVSSVDGGQPTETVAVSAAGRCPTGPGGDG